MIARTFERATNLDTHDDNPRGWAVGGASAVVIALIEQSVTIAFEIFVFSLDRTRGLKFEGYSRRRIRGDFDDTHNALALADPALFEPVIV